MNIDDQYKMYRLAHDLVINEDFKVLHINNKEEELWLEKFENRTSKVIRLICKGFDWKNYLKTDITKVFQKTKAMERFLFGKFIEIHNVYVSSYTPIDDWESLKKPMKLNERNPPKMNIYYVTENNVNEEINRLQNNIETPIKAIANIEDLTNAKNSINYYKTSLIHSLHESRNEVKNILSYGKPFLTYVLLALNVLMFFIVELNGGSTTENLIAFGAKYNPAIIAGEWWRIISSMFLHVGFLHLFMNMLALYYLGIAVERIYGSFRFLLIYLFAGIGGGLASFAFTANVAAGASGAIFGLFGALLFFGIVHKRIFLQTIGINLFVIVGINLVFGFVVPQIDNGAHVGGLIAGFLVSVALHLPNNRYSLTQLISLVAYIVMMLSMITYGINNDMNVVSYQLYEIDELIIKEEYEEVINIASEGLKLSSESTLEAQLLFQRSYANIQLNNPERAIEDLEICIEKEGEFAAAHYNLAMLYAEKGDDNKAKEAIKKAYDLMPDEIDYKNLYIKITGENPD